MPSASGGAVDFGMGEGAAALRCELRRLVAEHVPADFLGAFTGLFSEAS